MSYGGHVADMLSRLKNNESMRKKRPRVAERLQDIRLKNAEANDELRKHKKLSDEELLKYSKKAKKFSKKELRIRYTTYLIITLLIFFLLWYFAY